ncbi:hypothetical protein O4J56_13725 [Nocardiopsis sp. RSe5-2]|uniref:Uncharacterized protein n=1 Tax=Nocardiopsis endophytica TaxID=3018445 RepID=A0ABT4U429_9ACTN|nr:hypothetical protein [Nocardiopsis endophytica]MDA2811695.1 hypothetical protein [Nocardiopsis endophytica]
MSLLPSGAPASATVPPALDGHVLLQVKTPGPAPLADVSPVDGGLVFCGQKAADNAAEALRGREFTGPVLIDPSAYEKHVATPERPFITGQASLLVEDELEEELQRQRERKATMALTPTAYLRAGDRASLEAVAERAADLRGGDVLLTLPLDMGWLRGSRHDDLIALLLQIPVPKALILCAPRDPLATMGAARSLREIVSSVPGIGLLRSDMAALDAMVHGAGFAAVGDSASARHGPVPGGGGAPRPRRDPAVLFPRALSYHYGVTLATAFEGAAEVPRCHCGPCREWGAENDTADGLRPLTGFTDSADRAAAHRHNHAAWSMIWGYVMAAPDETEARRRWSGCCARALPTLSAANAVARRPDNPLKAPPALRVWARGGARPRRR